MAEKVLIIGGGITGLQAAYTLAELGINSIIVEKEPQLGGKVRQYSKVFPNFTSGKMLVHDLVRRIESKPEISVFLGSNVTEIARNDNIFLATLTNEKVIRAKAVILANGFETFDAKKQPEYGYGVYPDVITSVELERYLDPDGPTKGRLIRPSNGKIAEKIAIIFCVGSRNIRIGNPYCSRICCSYSTKQAIEIKENNRNASVVCFYMDIRTYGKGFEEMYQYAQELGVKYIRGRVSECSMLSNGDIQVRAENTLLGKPTQGTFDMVSLSVGMMPGEDTKKFADILRIERDKDGFFMPKNEYFNPHEASLEGVFIGGAATGLKPIRDCLIEGISVGDSVASYLMRLKKIESEVAKVCT